MLVVGALGTVGVFGSAPPTARAQADDVELSRQAVDLETPRGLALGTGVRATAGSTSSVAYNAAALPIASVYHLDALVGYAPSGHQLTFGGLVADSMTSTINAGLAVRGFAAPGQTGHSGWDGRLALALPLSTDFAVGVTGRYLDVRQEGDSPRADVQAGDSLVRGFTMDASARLSLGGDGARFHLAALAENLIDLGSDLAPRRVGGSGALTLEQLTLGGDVLVDLTTRDEVSLLAGGGIEYLAGGQIPVRAGYRFDEARDQHAVTAGLGYLETSFGAELALRQQVQGSRDTELLLTLRYFVN